MYSFPCPTKEITKSNVQGNGSLHIIHYPFVLLSFQKIIFILLYRSNRVLKPLTSRIGPPFALLDNRFIFDFHKTLDFPMEVTFSASHSTIKALHNMLPPFSAVSVPCTFALVYPSTALKERNSTWIKEVSTSSSPLPPLPEVPRVACRNHHRDLLACTMLF